MDSAKLFILAFACSIAVVSARPQFHWNPFFMELMKIPDILQGALVAGAGWSLPEDSSTHHYNHHEHFDSHENEHSEQDGSDFDDYDDNHPNPEVTIFDWDPEPSIDNLRQPLRWTRPNLIRRYRPDIKSFNPNLQKQPKMTIVDWDPELHFETMRQTLKGFLPDMKPFNPDIHHKPETTIIDWDRALTMDSIKESADKVISLFNPDIKHDNPVSSEEEVHLKDSANPAEDLVPINPIDIPVSDNVE